ncbi:MAG TPA: tRNA (adenosine(37)-N6)-threonylcarbamoyltransferase complex transferase subunit TsaD [Terrimicrobiaceae bacterium]
MSRLVLAIETSCDETSVAILREFDDVRAHRVASQSAIHAAYGGVVPEVASRNHLELLPELIRDALGEAGISLSQIDAFAATTGPGLAAALLVGASAAKGLALGAGKPFLAVNHLEGHLLSPFFGESEIPAHVALIVSGGHTLLFDVEGYGQYHLLGRTLDDAAGEAFDKTAKLLGLGYPGGSEVDRLARQGVPARFSFPRSMIGSGDLNFSFSGLKTSARYFLESGFDPKDLPDICASFQEAVVDVLVAKLARAAAMCGRTLLGLSGGVSANARLRECVARMCEERGFSARIPPAELRTDNALMIAYAAAHRSDRGSPIDSDIHPNFDPALLAAAER